MTLYTDSGDPVAMGEPIGRGGEGIIYLVLGHPDLVCKVFSVDPTGTPIERRIPAMLSRRPASTILGLNSEPQLCWPTATVHHRDGRLAGFLMPYVRQTRSTAIHRITNPTDLRDTTHMRTAGFRQWRYLVRAAANLATAVSGLHPGIVIGDFNANNILVSEQTWITLIDCDSMQLTDQQTGETFYCNSCRPEYFAPELTGLDLTRHRREPASDNFALAIHIHQLLLHGFHPFSGRWVGPGDTPEQADRIRQGTWYHESALLRPPRSAPDTAAVLPDEIIGMFHDAFVTGATDPRQRPSADAWAEALLELHAAVIRCRRDRLHWYPRQQRSCPWCSIASDTFRDSRTRQVTEKPVAWMQSDWFPAAARPGPSTEARTPRTHRRWLGWLGSLGRMSRRCHRELAGWLGPGSDFLCRVHEPTVHTLDAKPDWVDAKTGWDPSYEYRQIDLVLDLRRSARHQIHHAKLVVELISEDPGCGTLTIWMDPANGSEEPGSELTVEVGIPPKIITKTQRPTTLPHPYGLQSRLPSWEWKGRTIPGSQILHMVIRARPDSHVTATASASARTRPLGIPQWLPLFRHPLPTTPQHVQQIQVFKHIEAHEDPNKTG